MSTSPLFLLLVSPPPAAPQQLLYEIRDQGGLLTPVGDLDGDGSTDFLAGRLRAHSGRTGDVLFAFDLATSGLEAENLGDVDGDGLPELVLDGAVYRGSDLLAPLPVPPTELPPPLYVLTPPPGVLATFGVHQVAILGGHELLDDLDGDGVREVLTGWPDMVSWGCGGDHVTTWIGATGGVVQIASGRNGTVLREIVEPVQATGAGGLVLALDDLDGDGASDFAVAARGFSPDPYLCRLHAGRFLRAHSSATGGVLWELDVDPYSISRIPDTDRDGVEDLALGFAYSNFVEIRSGADGAWLRTLESPLPPDLNLYGHVVEPAGDLFGSGSPSLLVSAPQPAVPWTTGGPGAVFVHSLARHGQMVPLFGARTDDEFGSDVEYLGDVDGDGRPEVAIGVARRGGLGRIRVLSMNLGPSASDPVRIPGRPQGIR